MFVEAIAKAVGVDRVKAFDPYNIDGSVEAIERGIKTVLEGGVALLVARRICSLPALRLGLIKGAYTIDSGRCVWHTLCFSCYSVPDHRS